MFVEKRTTGQYNLKKTPILILLITAIAIYSKEAENPLASDNTPTKYFRYPPAPVIEEVQITFCEDW